MRLKLKEYAKINLRLKGIIFNKIVYDRNIYSYTKPGSM